MTDTQPSEMFQNCWISYLCIPQGPEEALTTTSTTGEGISALVWLKPLQVDMVIPERQGWSITASYGKIPLLPRVSLQNMFFPQSLLLFSYCYYHYLK